MSDDTLLWIVPARRAVLRRSLSYFDVMGKWLSSLETYKPQLMKWYSVIDPSYEAGLGALRQWRSSYYPAGTDASVVRDGLTTLNLLTYNFYLRLWKGPLRILLETSAQPVPLGEEIANPRDITIEHGGSVTVKQNERGEVTNQEARFLMGDVVEFPLFKFLGACGLSDYGTLPNLDDKLKFNAKGSFLLGTSVEDHGGNSPSEGPELHDNLVAMRFQLLLSAAIGAFYHLDQEVFEGLKSFWGRPLSVAEGGRTVHARGLIYAASLGDPVSTEAKSGAPEHWKVENSNWGCSKDGEIPDRLPTAGGMKKLGTSFVLTPGMTCSPATLFLSIYMMRHFAKGEYGRGSVGSAFTKPKHAKAVLRETYEFSSPNELQELVPRVSDEELRNRLNRLISEIEKVLARITGQTSYSSQLIQAGKSDSALWSQIRPDSQSGLEAKSAQPEQLWKTIVSIQENRRTPSSEKAALQQFQAKLVEETVRFRDHLGSLLKSEEWGQFSWVMPDVVKVYSKELLKLRALPGEPHINAKGVGAVERLRDALKKKLAQLKKKQATGTGLSPSIRVAQKDLSDYLSEINTVSLNGHEWGVVRLHDFKQLADSVSLPRAGYLAAYDPLSGQTYFTADCVPQGQFYVFEASDSLPGWTHRIKTCQLHVEQPSKKVKECGCKDETYMLCGCNPFKWTKIEGNRFSISLTEKTKGTEVRLGPGGLPYKKEVDGLIRLKGQNGGYESLARVHLEDPKAFRPIFIYPKAGAQADKATLQRARKRLIDNGMVMYASRAVPFPTLSEVADAFPDSKTVQGNMDRLRELAEANSAKEVFLKAL